MTGQTGEGTFVTTGWKPSPQVAVEAEQLAGRLGLPYVRRSVGLERLYARTGARFALVVERTQRTLHMRGRRVALRFHGGMGLVRLRHALAGRPDGMLLACDLRPGEVVIDATAGLCGDALLAAHAVGPGGRVIAVEKSPLLAAVVAHGLAHTRLSPHAADAARRRITLVTQDHLAYLAGCPDKSVDLVFFEPMFDAPAARLEEFEILAAVADPSPVREAALREAARVARRRVVLQVHRDSDAVERLGLRPLPVGRSSVTRYGVLDL